jgi:hypothetical protein
MKTIVVFKPARIDRLAFVGRGGIVGFLLLLFIILLQVKESDLYDKKMLAVTVFAIVVVLLVVTGCANPLQTSLTDYPKSGHSQLIEAIIADQKPTNDATVKAFNVTCIKSPVASRKKCTTNSSNACGCAARPICSAYC